MLLHVAYLVVDQKLPEVLGVAWYALNAQVLRGMTVTIASITNRTPRHHDEVVGSWSGHALEMDAGQLDVWKVRSCRLDKQEFVQHAADQQSLDIQRRT